MIEVFRVIMPKNIHHFSEWHYEHLFFVVRNDFFHSQNFLPALYLSRYLRLLAWFYFVLHELPFVFLWGSKLATIFLEEQYFLFKKTFSCLSPHQKKQRFLFYYQCFVNHKFQISSMRLCLRISRFEFIQF